jgi:3-oxoacyl-[acyl-carrier protein] reductase
MLTGTVALVTGAGGGIGRAAALALGRRGVQVVVHCFRNREGADAVARAIDPQLARSLVVSGDVTRAGDVEAIRGAVLERFGRLDILVNNAGDMIERHTLSEMTTSRWHEVIDLNLTSVFLLCQAWAPTMIAQRSAAIVNVSSLAAHNGGGPGAFAYAAAKGGVMTLTKALAKELAPQGIRVNCVAPGLIDGTAFHARHTARPTFDAIAQSLPLGRAGTPEEVADAIVFLAGPESSYLTGETIEINGGMLMR